MTACKRVLTNTDRRRLGRFLINPETRGIGSRRARIDLEVKVEEAGRLPDETVPRSLVTMNSTVNLVDIKTHKHRTCTLVYPEDLDLYHESVGILQQLGQGILGRSVGDVVIVGDGPDARRLLIKSIPFQPEAAGTGHR